MLIISIGSITETFFFETEIRNITNKSFIGNNITRRVPARPCCWASTVTSYFFPFFFETTSQRISKWPTFQFQEMHGWREPKARPVVVEENSVHRTTGLGARRTAHAHVTVYSRSLSVLCESHSPPSAGSFRSHIEKPADTRSVWMHGGH